MEVPFLTTVRARRRSVTTTIVLASALACSVATEDGQEGFTVDTLASGVVLVSNSDLAAAARLQLVEELRVGKADGSFTGFGQILQVVSGANGHIYVADWQALEVLRFDAQGGFVGVIGRRGEGPGEFAISLAGIVWQNPNRLWAADARRIMAFDSSGATLNGHSHTRSGSNSSYWRGWPDANGMLYSLESQLHLGPGGPAAFVRSVVGFRVSEDHSLIPTDTFVIPVLPTKTRLTDHGGGLVEMHQLPMSSRMLATIGPAGTIWLANSSHYRIHEVTFGGDTLRTIELAHEPEPLTGAERDSVADAAPGFSAAELPDTKSAITSLRVARDGWIWVQPARESSTAWDVFNECGRYLGQVEPDRSTSLRSFPGGLEVLGVTRDDLGVEYAVRLSLQVPEGLAIEWDC